MDRLSEAPISSLEEPLVGVGPMPADFDRFNWGALLFGPLWALLHGNWPWFRRLIIVRVAQIVFAGFARSKWASTPPPAVTVVISAVGVGYVVLLLVFASRANREYWAKLARATESGPGIAQKTVAAYIAQQRLYILAGALLYLLQLAEPYLSRSDFSIPPRPPLSAALTPLALLVAMLLVASLVAALQSRSAGRRHG